MTCGAKGCTGTEGCTSVGAGPFEVELSAGRSPPFSKSLLFEVFVVVVLFNLRRG